MIFNRDRIAKLSGLMVESKDGSDKAKAKAGDFGGGKIEDELFLNGEVTTESVYEEEDTMEGSEEDEEAAVREMIQTELSAAKKEMEAEVKEEQAVREAVRKEIRDVLRSRGASRAAPRGAPRGVSLGGTGFGFKR